MVLWRGLSCLKLNDNYEDPTRVDNPLGWAGFSRYAGIPTGRELVGLITASAESSERETFLSFAHTLPEAAELFVDMRNGPVVELIRLLEKLININPTNIEIHRLLTETVQIRTIVTTNYDKLFELAYGNDIVTLSQDEHVPTHGLDERVKLYKIHGDFSSPTKMILRKGDYERFYSDRMDEVPLWSQIKSMLSTSSILFWVIRWTTLIFQPSLSRSKNIWGHIKTNTSSLPRTFPVIR